MTDEVLFEKIKTVIVQSLDVKPEAVTREARVREDLGADSLDTVELMMSLEDEFQMKISEEDAEKVAKVQDIVDYISKSVDISSLS